MKYSSFFQIKDRNTYPVHHQFFCCIDKAPVELKDFIKEVHGKVLNTLLPSDWAYKTLYHAFVELEENAFDEISIEADCYNNELIKWIEENYSTDFIDEAFEQGLHDGSNFINAIMSGQYLAKLRIYESVNEFLNYQKSA